MSTKICTKCNKEKSINDFALNKDTKDGRYSSCKECKNSWKRVSYNVRDGVNVKSLKARFNLGQRRAKERNHEWNLDFTTYKQMIENNCFYCKQSVLLETGYNIDRKDNLIGYTIENSVCCCADCNVGKSDRFSSDEWKIAIEAIMLHRRLV